MLVDVAEIKVKAGNGGDGHVSFRREKNVARGGPDGGDGGNGGSVFIQADHNMATLMDFRAKTIYQAENGQEGGKKKKTGAAGEDIVIKVPAGTLVYEIQENREVLLADLVNHGQSVLIAQGGIGGKGNYKFKSSTNQAPRQYIPGSKGQSKVLRLEIKMLADVGLVGLPNAGKSTLINQLTPAKAKIGSYPFTTITPNLGNCRLPNGKEIIVADIPGLIEGASEGKGLGDAFLKHIERTKLLVHVVDPLVAYENPEKPDFVRVLESYKEIRKELENYSTKLLEKEEIVVVNKLDVTEIRENFDKIKAVFEKEGVEILGISAVTGDNISGLKQKIADTLDTIPERIDFEVSEPVKTYSIESLPNRRIVFNTPEEKED